MHSAIPLRLQISSRADKAQGFFLAFLRNTGCFHSVLQDDIFKHCLSHNPETAPCCQCVYLTRPWGKACGCHLSKNAVAKPGLRSLLIYRADHAVMSLTGALPGGRTCYTRTPQEILDLEQLNVFATKPKIPSPHSHQWNAVQADQQTVWDFTYIHPTHPHSPLGFRGYSPQILANSGFNGAIQLLASQWLCEPKPPHGWPSASKVASIWTSGSGACMSP